MARKIWFGTALVLGAVTGVSCEYRTSDGRVFECNGTDCASGNPSAAEALAEWCVAR
jgi:hypothetical protein